MNERRRHPARLEIGQEVVRTPETIFEETHGKAIRWHMGAYDNAAKGDGRALSAAMAASPWVWRLQQADMCAAWVDEREAAEE